MPARLQLTGQKFGRLTVERDAPEHQGEPGQSYWLCRCECGSTKTVKGSYLKRGIVVSCGCSRKESSVRAAAKAALVRRAVRRPPIDNGDGTHSIPLTKGMVALVDSEDVHRVGDRNWSASRPPGSVTFYATRCLRTQSGHFAEPLHRVVMDAPDDMEVDHINGDTLDNRRCNLRLATRAENSCNRRISRNNTSGYKGVSFDKKRGVWVAYITVARRRRHLGSFPAAELAHEAYCKAALELHGEFARFA